MNFESLKWAERWATWILLKIFHDHVRNNFGSRFKYSVTSEMILDLTKEWRQQAGFWHPQSWSPAYRNCIGRVRSLIVFSPATSYVSVSPPGHCGLRRRSYARCTYSASSAQKQHGWRLGKRRQSRNAGESGGTSSQSASHPICDRPPNVKTRLFLR